jgi:hypothetical protein
MQVPLKVWETVALIINNEFIETGEPLTAKMLIDLILSVNADYHEEIAENTVDNPE